MIYRALGWLLSRRIRPRYWWRRQGRSLAQVMGDPEVYESPGYALRMEVRKEEG